MRKFYSKRDLGRSFALVAFVMLVSSVALSGIFSFAYDVDGNLPDWAFWLMQGLYSAVVGVVAFVYAKCTKTRFLDATSAARPPKIAHLGWGILADMCLIAVMLPLNTWILRLLTNLTGTTYGVDMPMQIVPMLLVACVLPAFTEEFAFRGTVAQSLRNGNKLGALAISGALFALIHFNPAQTLHQFALGALLALLMFRSDSIWTAVLVHLFNNAFAVIFTFAVPDESVLSPYFVWIFVLGLVGFAASIFGYIKTTQSGWEKRLPQTELFDCDGDVCGVTDEDVQDKTSKALFAVSVSICALMWLLTLLA